MTVPGSIQSFRSVLVTGANGFVGRYLVPSLQARLSPGAALHCIGRDRPDSVDLLDRDSVDAAVRRHRPDLVVHLAAQSSVGQSAGMAAGTWLTNVAGTTNLAKSVAEHCPQAVVAFASSSEVYGAAFKGGPVDERTLPQPLSPYSRSKRAAEDALADTLSATNRLITFRPTNHSGAGQDTRFVLPAFAAQVARIEAGLIPPTIKVGSLTAERDFLDVRDVVRAYLAGIEAAAEGNRLTLNIASGRVVPVGRLLDGLLKITKVDIQVEQDPARMRPSDIPSAEVDSRAIRELTGWKPQIDLDDTIADVLGSYRRQVASNPPAS